MCKFRLARNVRQNPDPCRFLPGNLSSRPSDPTYTLISRATVRVPGYFTTIEHHSREAWAAFPPDFNNSCKGIRRLCFSTLFRSLLDIIGTNRHFLFKSVVSKPFGPNDQLAHFFFARCRNCPDRTQTFRFKVSLFDRILCRLFRLDTNRAVDRFLIHHHGPYASFEGGCAHGWDTSEAFW